MTNKIDIDNLLELEAKATHGWEYDDGVRYGGCEEPPMPQTKPSIKIGDMYIEFDNWGGDYDAELIVTMRNALPSLLAELKAARKVVEAARVYFKERHLECERTCDVHPQCDHCHLCEDDLVELSQTRSEIEGLLKELDGEK